MIKGFRQIASLTFLSRIFGMLRDIAYSYFFGAAGLMDAWTIAFKIPNLARRMFGEGAASASFIPIYSEELEKDPDAAKRLACTVVTVIFVLLSVLVLIGWGGIAVYRLLTDTNDETRLALNLSSIMLPYMIAVCTVAILAGILNVHRHFAAPAAAPIVLNVIIISAMVVTGKVFNIPSEKQVFYVAAAVLLAGVGQFAIQVPPLRRAGVSIRPAFDIHSKAFRKIIFLMAPMILGLTVTQLNTLADDLIAWWFSASEEKGTFFMFLGSQVDYPLTRGSVSQLYFSQRLYQLPLGVFGISLATAIFPVMSALAAKKNYTSLTRTLSKGLAGTIFVALPATVGMIVVARPLVAVLFQHGEFTAKDTDNTSWTLCFYAVGLCGFFAQQITTRAFYSMQDSKIPAMTAVIAVLVNIILNLTLIWPLGTGGLALSTALCSYLQVAILLIILKRRFGQSSVDGLSTIAVKTFISSIAMAGAGVGVLYLLRTSPETAMWDAVRLSAVLPVCSIVYIFISRLLGNDMLSLIMGRGELK